MKKSIILVLCLVMAVVSAFAWDTEVAYKEAEQGLRWIGTYNAVGQSTNNNILLILTASTVGNVAYDVVIKTTDCSVAGFDVTVKYGQAFSNVGTTNVYTNGATTGSNLVSVKPESSGTSPARVFHIGANAVLPDIKTAPSVLMTERFGVGITANYTYTLGTPLLLAPGKYYSIEISNRAVITTNLNYNIKLMARKIK